MSTDKEPRVLMDLSRDGGATFKVFSLAFIYEDGRPKRGIASFKMELDLDELRHQSHDAANGVEVFTYQDELLCRLVELT